MDVVAIVAIIGLVGLLGVKEYFNYKERIDMAKINRAKDVSEIEYLVPSSTPEPDEEEEQPLVQLEDMPELSATRE